MKKPRFAFLRRCRRKIPLFLLGACLLFSAAPSALGAGVTGPTRVKLEVLRQAYETAVAGQIPGTPAGGKPLDAGYLDSLNRQLSLATREGRLEEAVALKAEAQRVREGGPLPETDSGAPPALLRLRAAHRAELGKLRAARDRILAPIRDRYRRDLQELETSLTKAGALEDALAVREVRTSLPDEATGPPSPAPKTPPARAAGRTDAKAAEEICLWALANDSTVLTDAGEVGPASKLTAPPKGRFRVLGVTTGKVGDFPWASLKGLSEITLLKLNFITSPPTSAYQALEELPRLEILQLEGPPLTAELVNALPPLPRLAEITFRASPELPAVLGALKKQAPNLSRLRIFRIPAGQMEAACAALPAWPRLSSIQMQGTLTTPAALHLAKLPELRELMFYTGSDDTDPAALAPLRQIRRLSLNGRTKAPDLLAKVAVLTKLEDLHVDMTKQSADTLAQLAKLPDLVNLGLENVTEGTDGAAAAIASLKSLTQLHVTDSDLTDAGLKELEKLRGLKELKLIRTQVTAAGIKAFQKARSRCRVIQ